MAEAGGYLRVIHDQANCILHHALAVLLEGEGGEGGRREGGRRGRREGGREGGKVRGEECKVGTYREWQGQVRSCW